MQAEEVIKLYRDLQANQVPIWIDGGWCVDALLGEVIRSHADLDLAVESLHESRLKKLLSSWGYFEESRDPDVAWNYVMKDSSGRSVDIHVFQYDESGNNVYGIAYPFGSLTGTGRIRDQVVNCVSPEWMFRFKTGYAPADKDRHDVQMLAERFKFEVPSSHRMSGESPSCSVITAKRDDDLS